MLQRSRFHLPASVGKYCIHPQSSVQGYPLRPLGLHFRSDGFARDPGYGRDGLRDSFGQPGGGDLPFDARGSFRDDRGAPRLGPQLSSHPGELAPPSVVL